MIMPVQRSVSTWQQPEPRPASAERTALLEDVADQVVRLGPGRLRVAVDGLTASGKTSLGHELGAAIAQRGRPVLRASLDDFKRPWRDRHRYDRESGPGYYRNAFDYPAVVRLLLAPCAQSGSGRCVLCMIDPLTQVDHSSVVVEAAANAVLVVDGVFAFRPEVDAHWDFRVWLAVDEETSVRRGAARDQDWAGSDAETIHRDRYLPAERIYLAEADPVARADVVIDNTFFDRPRVLRRSLRSAP